MDQALLERIQRRHGSIQIVDFTIEYVDQVVLGAAEMHRNSIYSDMPLDNEKVVRELACCGRTVGDRYFRLAVRDGKVLGGFFGRVFMPFFCDDLVAQDAGWWVLEYARGTAAAILLLVDFEQWAREKGAKKVMVCQTTALEIERTTKLYEHCGFSVIGFNTSKDL
jgi:hypothetical protein